MSLNNSLRIFTIVYILVFFPFFFFSLTTDSPALSGQKPHWLPVCAIGGGDEAGGGGRGGKVSGTPRPPRPPLSPPASEAAAAETCLAERSG